MPDLLPVYLNGRQFSVSAPTTLADLLEREDAPLAEALSQGLARATDGRGIPVTGDAPVIAGAIFRVFRSARAEGPANNA